MELINISGVDVDLLNVLVFVPLLISFILYNKAKNNTHNILLATAVIIAFSVNIINTVSLLILITYAAACMSFEKYDSKPIKAILGCAILILTIVLMGHLLPGIDNPVIIKDYIVSQEAPKYTKYLNFDKAIAGLLLLLYVVPKPKAVTYKSKIYAVLVATISTFSALLIAISVGLIKIDPKWNSIIYIWAITNLFFTCFAEEAFFRGFIQEQIMKVTGNNNYLIALAVIFSGLLFGLVHWSVGPTYVALATTMGIAYSYIFYITKNIYWPIGTHFIFNMIHFTVFTYPYLK